MNNSVLPPSPLPIRRQGISRLIWVSAFVLMASALWLLQPVEGMPLWKTITEPADSLAATVFYSIRLPRILMAMLTGGALALSGLVFQTVFRNELATPYTLGVSSGAACGAFLAMKCGWISSMAGIPVVAGVSFVGAVLTVSLILMFSAWRGDFRPETMLLVGVALSFFFTSAIMIIQYLSDFSESFYVMRWMMGDLGTIGYAKPLAIGGLLVPSLVWIGFRADAMDLLAGGEELAQARGVPVTRVKVELLTIVSLMTGMVVATCGPIGFVGLMAPHMARLIIGPIHRRLVGLTVIGGGAFLVCCDGLSRVLIAPAEIPVGILTGLCGGPFFLWLLINRRRFQA